MKAIHKLTLVGLALIGGVAGCSSQKEVPMLEGMDQKSAEAQIVELGFKVGRIENEFNPQKDAGKVLRQMPAASARAKKGTAIHLTVAESVTLPDLEGMEALPAKNALVALGLRVKTEKQNRQGPTSGLVAQQIPAAGDRVAGKSSVTIIVDEFIVSTPVTDESFDEAKKRLQQAGILAVKKNMETSAAKTPGIVLRQDPDAFQKISKETAVNIYVAEAPPERPKDTVVSNDTKGTPAKEPETKQSDAEKIIKGVSDVLKGLKEKEEKPKPSTQTEPNSTGGGSGGSAGAGGSGASTNSAGATAPEKAATKANDIKKAYEGIRGLFK